MNFILDNIFLVIVALFSAGSLIRPYLFKSPKISQLDATQLMNKGKAAILDIREQAEYRTGHLRNSINIPQKELADKMGKLEKFKSQPVIVVCQTGKRASNAISQLKKAGFKEVYGLDGGIDAWLEKGLPTTK